MNILIWRAKLKEKSKKQPMKEKMIRFVYWILGLAYNFPT